MEIMIETHHSHITDSLFYGHSYSTEVSRTIFDHYKRMQRFLDVEAVLAQCQAELGIIPEKAAKAIAEAADFSKMDAQAISKDIQDTGHSLVALIRALRDCCEGDYGEYVHYGATTQDIQDTAQNLEIREVLACIENQQKDLLRLLTRWAKRYRSIVMPGRTHARAAAPITFGYKVAVWIDELLRFQERLEQMKERVMVASLHGAVGSMAGFGTQAEELLGKFAAKMGLKAPAIAWHVSRDRVTEYVLNLAMLTATLAKIADEIRTMERPEFGELRSQWSYGKVSSSTMPHKRNPEKAQQIVVLAKLAKAQTVPALEAMHNEHERDSRGLRLEWAVVADVSHYALAALDKIVKLVEGTDIMEEQMKTNTLNLLDMLSTEAIMLKLGEKIGKETAYQIVYDISQHAQSSGTTIRDGILQNKEIIASLNKTEIKEALDPNQYLGKCEAQVDTIIKLYEERKT